MTHRRSDQVKMCNIVPDRPGILQPFMTPTKLKNQVRSGGSKNDLQFSPTGKTLTGGVQWTIKTQRPGIAESLIHSKSEQKALAKGMAMEAKIANGNGKAQEIAQEMAKEMAKGMPKEMAEEMGKEMAKGMPKEMAKMKAASAEAEKAVDPTANGGMSGYGYSW